MALRLQKRSWKNADGSTSSTWRLIVEDFTQGERRCLYPAKHEYLRYGLDPQDPYEKALEKLHVVRAQNKATRVLERRARIDERIRKELNEESAYLPSKLYLEFLEWLTDRRMWNRIPKKTESHLQCMRHLIRDVKLDPSEWPNRPEKIYRWFQSKKLSVSYLEKVMPLLNDYGYFYCREMKKPYVPISPPSRDMLRRIEDANLEARAGRQAASKPILPHQLEELADLPDEQVRWLEYAIFFGLRPHEVDSLTPAEKGKTWLVTKDSRGTRILNVFQSKLVKIERDRRWKRIPCILEEQERLIQEIEQGLPVKRPYPKTLQDKLGEEGVGTYGGRKAFEKLMRENGQSFINISRWLGHQDLGRTERNYREKEAVDYDPVRRR